MSEGSGGPSHCLAVPGWMFHLCRFENLKPSLPIIPVCTTSCNLYSILDEFLLYFAS